LVFLNAVVPKAHRGTFAIPPSPLCSAISFKTPSGTPQWTRPVGSPTKQLSETSPFVLGDPPVGRISLPLDPTTPLFCFSIITCSARYPAPPPPPPPWGDFPLGCQLFTFFFPRGDFLLLREKTNTSKYRGVTPLLCLYFDFCDNRSFSPLSDVAQPREGILMLL